MKPTIYQTAHVFVMSTMSTFEAILENGRQGFKRLSDGFTSFDDLPSLADIVFVLPVEPLLGDQVITYHEGQMVMGSVAGMNIGGEGKFMLDLDGVADYVVLTRNLFHVVEARQIAEEGSYVVAGDGAVVVSSTNANFPFGTRAIIRSITPRASPTADGAMVIIATNGLDQTWDASGVTFRPFDATVIDFNFTDEAQIIPKNNAAVIEEINIHDVNDLDSSEIEGLGEEIPELSDENIGMYVTDHEGNPVAWEDIPDDVRAVMTSISEQLKASAEFNEAVPEEVDADQPADQTDDESEMDAAVGSFFTSLLGAAYIAQAIQEEEDRIDAQITAFATESEMVQDEHVEYITDGLNEMNERITKAVADISLITNLVGRIVSRAKSDEDSARFDAIYSALTNLRNDVIEIGKCSLDVSVDVKVNTVVQDEIAARAGALL